MECDARKIVVLEVLRQEGRPVEFFSERLNEENKRYSHYDLEQYALVKALNKWRHYLATQGICGLY